MNIAFVTNICAHYRVRTFEILAQQNIVNYYFFSQGDEWYWQQQHGVKAGQFNYEYLRGIRIGNTRITIDLLWKLLRNPYDVYIKCINGRFALPLTYAIARIKRKPLILWTGIWMRVQTPFHRLIFPFTRYIYHHADAIVVYGEHVKQYLISEGVKAERIFVAAHAIDNQEYSCTIPDKVLNNLREKLGIDSQQKIVLYLGRLEEVKGINYLISAFAAVKHHDATLVIAGTGSLQQQLMQTVENEGLKERVRFVGYVPTNEAVMYYALAWVYVLPSITTKDSKETWGLSVNEAFNQGVPVIVTESVGAAAGGLVENDINGFVIPERNTNLLAQRLEQILNEPELRHQMGKNAKLVIDGWTNEKMVSGFQEAITFVTNKGQK